MPWSRRFEDPRTRPVKGVLKGKEATLTYREGAKHGDATVKLDDSGRWFSGSYQYGEGQRIFVRDRGTAIAPTSRRRKGRRAGSTASG